MGGRLGNPGAGGRWRRAPARTARALLLVAAAAVLAACSSTPGKLAVGTGVTAPAPTTSVAAPAPATSVAMAAHGLEDAATSIPWSQVGPGWFLALWGPTPQTSPSGSQVPSPDETLTLFLVDPLGGRYAITTLPPPQGSGWSLADWSGDGRRALLTAPGSDPNVEQVQVREIDLATGTTLHQFTLQGSSSAPMGVRYTRPNGTALLVEGGTGARPALTRVDLTGAPQLSYPTRFGASGTYGGSYLSSPDGTQLVVGTSGGMALIGNDGSVVRTLGDPAGGQGCSPVRWWSTGQVLATCQGPVQTGTPSADLLWLVPVDGSAPSVMTAPPTAPDDGDGSAWPIGTDTYLQAHGACGTEYLAKLNPDRTTSPVTVPGVAPAASVAVLGTYRDQLALESTLGCGGDTSLLWFAPGSNVVTPLLGPPLNGGAVVVAIPFPTGAN